MDISVLSLEEISDVEGDGSDMNNISSDGAFEGNDEEPSPDGQKLLVDPNYAHAEPIPRYGERVAVHASVFLSDEGRRKGEVFGQPLHARYVSLVCGSHCDRNSCSPDTILMLLFFLVISLQKG
jgi:hypothetical protein